MSEMLANQYFMIRKYSLAKEEYEKLLTDKETDDKLLKKLIVCYVVSNELEKAFHLFFELIKKDPYIIINTKLEDEDCPCHEIIPQIQNDQILFNDKEEKNLALGILSLFCNKNDSLNYLNKLSKEIYNQQKIKEAVQIINQTNY
jgi:tetratricopeptide (TPR) repeat protein